jgi:hypothetical protein
MSDPVIYMRGLSFHPEMPIGVSFFKNASSLAEFDNDKFDGLISNLEVHEGFMDQATLSNLIESALGDAEKSKAIAVFVDVLHERIRKSAGHIDRFVDEFKEWNSKEAEKLDDIKLDLACSRVRRILASHPCYMRQAKAERLMSLIGKPLQSVDLVCDIRPVFSEDRTAIEGMFPYAWLKLVATEQSGLPSSFETVLSTNDLELFHDAIVNAKKKIEELTRVIRKDSRLASTKHSNHNEAVS